MKITIEFYIFKLIYILNFSFKKPFRYLEQISQITPKKGISDWKQNKQSKDYKRLIFVW